MNKNVWDSVLRHGIGFDPLFFERIAEAPNFPPHNIAQITEDQFQLTLAVAGFREEDIDITQHNDILTITGARPPAPPHSELEGYRLLYSGIAFRDFSRQFKVGEHVHVEAAALQDGLLVIDLIRRVPEAMKPKRIPVGNKPVEQSRLDT
jgi:molecular chaperone IbpA